MGDPVTRYLTITCLLAALALCAGCSGSGDDAETWNESVAETGTTDTHADAAAPPQPAPGGQPGGRVLEAFDSGGYTYLRLQTPDGEMWAAAPVTAVAVGDDVTLAGAMVMQGFRAASLDRTFDEIWFASAILGGGAAAGTGHGHTPKAAADEDAAGDLDLAPPAGGLSIAALHAGRADYAGQRVKLRGRVVKSLTGIMGRNWLHLQDGSGDVATGDHDITVTSEGTAPQGATVRIEGTVAVDKDFGSGYFYTVIVEDATVTVEEAM